MQAMNDGAVTDLSRPSRVQEICQKNGITEEEFWRLYKRDIKISMQALKLRLLGNTGSGASILHSGKDVKIGFLYRIKNFFSRQGAKI